MIVEIRIQTHSNCTINKIVHNFHISRNRVLGDFWGSLISRILDFSGFCEFGFQTLLVGIIFRGFHVQYLKVTKKGSHLIVFVTLFATNFTEVQQCKNARSKYLRVFCWRTGDQ